MRDNLTLWTSELEEGDEQEEEEEEWLTNS